MGKRKEKAKVSFVGMNATDVTGSMVHVNYKNGNILLDAGFYQCGSKLKQWNTNARNFKFKIKELDSIIISHLNLDHWGSIGRLYNQGCSAKIYIPQKSKEYLAIALKDSLKIQEKDIEYIKRKTGKKPRPLFTQEDVIRLLDNVIEVDFEKKFSINQFMHFRYVPAYHILNSAQVELFIRDESANYRKKIYYSGDLGNTLIKDKPFLNGYRFVENADLCLVESTYCMNKKEANQKKRLKDREKLNTHIRESCIENDNSTIIATFSYQRAQELLWELYMMYGEDEGFKIPIIVDSPLTICATRLFEKMCEGYDLDKIEKILNWENVKFINDWEDSVTARETSGAKIVLSASGFANAGRIREWFKKELPNEKSTIVFVGYSDEESLSGKLKSNKYKWIDIDGEKVDNKAKICNLLSFSSHMQHNTLLKTYSNMNTQQIYLIHGNMANRLEFAQLLEDEYRKKCKTTNVYVPLLDMTVTL